MNRSVTHTRPTDTIDVEFSALPLRLPDAGSAVEDALAKALEYAAHKTGAHNLAAVFDALRRRDVTTVQYTAYGLACQLAETLGALDETVKAVYLFDAGATGGDEVFDEPASDLSIHLIVWAERKTKALAALISGLDRALMQAVTALQEMPAAMQLLDAQIVDTAEVQQRIGYGALLSSLHYRPLPIWQR